MILVIAVQNFNSVDIPDLQGPFYDVSNMCKIWEYAQQPYTILLNPTKNEVIQKIKDIGAELTCIYWSGHGANCPTGEGLVCKVDSTNDYVIWDTELADLCESKPGLILDTCFSGGMIRANARIKSIVAPKIKSVSNMLSKQSQLWNFFAAASLSTEPAYEIRLKQNSVGLFTWSLYSMWVENKLEPSFAKVVSKMKGFAVPNTRPAIYNGSKLHTFLR